MLYGFMHSQKGDLHINIRGINSEEGNIKVALYIKDNEKGFLKDLDLSIRKKIVIIKNKQAGVSFSDLPYGTYAVSLFHDINNNNILERAPIGYPIEPYGVSGNKQTLGPPKFDDCKFVINSPDKHLNIDLRTYKKKLP
jgi:uncharacterized protein (DUF2141 family)